MTSTTTVLQQKSAAQSSSFLRSNKVAANRAFDYAYDKNYLLSAQADHDHQAFAARTANSNLELQPIYRTMFSELRHHPRFTFQMKSTHGLPSHISQEWSGKNNYQREKMIVQKIMTGDESIHIPTKMAAEPCDVDGHDRYKFARRPLIPFLNSVPPYVVLDNYVTQELAALESSRLQQQTGRKSVAGMSGVKNMATQTDYRDGEAQTDPYSPEYVVKPGTQPELLTIGMLAYGRGLPVGLAEVEMIERLRAKRAWEAQLPPLNDPTQWDKRLRMMTEMERSEWLFREKEIQELQDIRMELLKKMLKDREENQAAILAKKLDRLWLKKQREKESKIRKLRIENIKNIRKLIKSREKMRAQIEHKQKNIIEEYSKFESEAYAPLTRHGYFPDRNADNYVVHNRYLDTYQGLMELEASLPNYVLKLQLKAPQRVTSTKDGYLKRKYREEKRLDNIYDNIMTEKDKNKSREEKPLRFLKEVERPAPRPPTPQIEVPDLDEEELDMAVIYLQKVLRGKAIQNMMHQGKEDNLVLIKECSSTHALQRADEAKTRDHKDRVLAAQRARNLDDRAQALSDEVLQSMEGETCADMLDFLSKELVRLQEERRIHAFAMLAERERRMREAEESGWRQVEERRRREEDEIFKQMLKVQQETVETYLEDCILETSEKVADIESRKEIQDMATKINDIAYDLEKNRTQLESEYIVAELVHGFLIPEAEKEVYRQQIKQKQEPYLIAAHKEIYNETNKVLNETSNSTNNPNSN